MLDGRDDRDRSPPPRRAETTRDLFAALLRSIAGDAARSFRRVRAGAPGRWRKLSAGVRSAGSALGRIPAAAAAPLRRTRPPLKLSRRAVILALVLSVFVGIGGATAWVGAGLPADAMNRAVTPVALLQAADGSRLTASGEVVGPYTEVSDFPDHLVDAVLSIEDRRFHSHYGFDLRGIARAAVRNVRAGGIVEGGSTVTQQLVKIAILGDDDRTFRRKLQELVLALQAEFTLGKDEILSRYLNAIYLGQGARGFPAAAELYFGKDVGALTVAESALLAGMIRAPSALNPVANPEGARSRARVVLAAMVDNGVLAAPAAEAAVGELARIRPEPRRTGTWFADWIAPEAAALAQRGGGTIRVRTTLDPALQRLAEQAVDEVLRRRGEAAGATEAALVVLRPDGAVLAMVGGRDYGGSTFNRAADALRQPGSTFKLFVAYAALKAGFSPLDKIVDRPVDVDGWKPENHSGRYFGRVSIAEAFARSLNAATVRLAMDVGIPAVAAAARELGIDTPLVETPSLALGASETTLLDLTGAYASVRAGVAPVDPWGIEAYAPAGSEAWAPAGPPDRPRVALGTIGRDLVGMLGLAVERGTGRRARLDRPAAGKTGTSQNYRDAWFVGFTEDMVVGVWVGNDKGEPMKSVTGGELPAEIWRRFMESADPGDEPLATGSIAVADEERDADVFEAPRACNIDACRRAYRSFRERDCTYQPWRGPRRICTR
jgi:penicillin-binding protein 1A